MYLPFVDNIRKKYDAPCLNGQWGKWVKESMGVPVGGLCVGRSCWLLCWFALEHW